MRLTTRKPPAGLVGAPGLEASGIDLDGLTEPRRVFSGTARQVVRGFPANLNVAVALSLAGPGPDDTHVEVWADPGVTRNTHTIVMTSDVADLTMTIENVPSENPRTGRITTMVRDFTAQEAGRHSAGWLVNLGRSRLVDCQ